MNSFIAPMKLQINVQIAYIFVVYEEGRIESKMPQIVEFRKWRMSIENRESVFEGRIEWNDEFRTILVSHLWSLF